MTDGGSGLTVFALVFMLVSMVSVTALMVYCFWRTLRGGDVAYETTDDPETGEGAGASPTAGGRSGESP